MTDMTKGEREALRTAYFDAETESIVHRLLGALGAAEDELRELRTWIDPMEHAQVLTERDELAEKLREAAETIAELRKQLMFRQEVIAPVSRIELGVAELKIEQQAKTIAEQAAEIESLLDALDAAEAEARQATRESEMAVPAMKSRRQVAAHEIAALRARDAMQNERDQYMVERDEARRLAEEMRDGLWFDFDEDNLPQGAAIAMPRIMPWEDDE